MLNNKKNDVFPEKNFSKIHVSLSIQVAGINIYAYHLSSPKSCAILHSCFQTGLHKDCDISRYGQM